MPEVHTASLTCERDDCPTTTLTSSAAAASVGCPAPGCCMSISIGQQSGGTPITQDNPDTPNFNELTGEFSNQEPTP